MSTNMPISLLEYIEREAQQCVLYAGPRLALTPVDAIGPPGTELLAARLMHRLGHQLDEYSLPWIAQVYADRNGVEALRRYVAEQLNDLRYRPTPAQHLIARIPFQFVVSTGQDTLLHQAYRDHQVAVDWLLPEDSLNFITKRTLLYLYGYAERPSSLLLTEDQRRQIFHDHQKLADFLRVRADTSCLLFLGYARNDAMLRELYQDLRPQLGPDTPRAYCIQAKPSEDDLRYWNGRNVNLIEMDEAAFLQQLAEVLAGRGRVQILPAVDYEEPAPLTAEERQERKELMLSLSSQLGVSLPPENRDQLQSSANSLSFMNRVLSENQRQDGDKLPQSSKEEGANTALILFQQGNAEWADGNHERAREYFQDAIDANRAMLDAYFALYYLLIEMDLLERAAEIYRQILVKEPKQSPLPPHYQLQTILGRTNIGIGYKVYDTDRATQVVVTVLHRSLTRRPEIVKEFIQEISTIESPYISRLLDADRYRGRSYLVTAYIEGQTLRHHLASVPFMALTDIFQRGDEICCALEDAHRGGVAYLDLRPDNIVISAKGAILVNFGFVKLQQSEESRNSIQRGQIEYQSPEQRRGETGDIRSDIYAVGTILYEMLVGRHPGIGPMEDASERRPEVDEAIDVVIAKARALEPQQRFRTITELRNELQRISPFWHHRTANQIIRRVLSWISDIAAHLVTLRGSLWLAMILLVAIGFESWVPLISLRGLSRGMLTLTVASLMPSILGYYIIREFARTKGLGSLISTGRGIGIIFGWLLGFWILRATEWPQGTSLQFASLRLFLEYEPIVFTFAILFAVLALFLLRGCARLTEQLWNRYTLGFYSGFMLICILCAAMAWWRVGYGIIRF